jgi:hypothetical protein
MDATHRHQPDECPQLQPSRPFSSSGRIIGIYCRRPDGAVRVPRRDEVRTFCLTGRWRECPGNRRHASAE